MVSIESLELDARIGGHRGPVHRCRRLDPLLLPVSDLYRERLGIGDFERNKYQETAGTKMPAAHERGTWRSQIAPSALRLAGAIVGGLVIATRRIAPQCEHNNGDTGDDVNSRRSHPS